MDSQAKTSFSASSLPTVISVPTPAPTLVSTSDYQNSFIEELNKQGFKQVRLPGKSGKVSAGTADNSGEDDNPRLYGVDTGKGIYENAQVGQTKVKAMAKAFNLPMTSKAQTSGRPFRVMITPMKPGTTFKHSEILLRGAPNRFSPPITNQPGSSANNITNNNRAAPERNRAESIDLAALSMDPVINNGNCFGFSDCHFRSLYLKLIFSVATFFCLAWLYSFVLEQEGLAIASLVIGLFLLALLGGLTMCHCCDLILTAIIEKALRASPTTDGEEEKEEGKHQDENRRQSLIQSI